MALLFFDLDGTLLYGGIPVDGVVDAIRELKENGHIPIIATGRVPDLLYDLPTQLGIDSYICANGNYIVYREKLIYERYMPRELVARFLRMADRERFDVVVECKSGFYAYRKEGVIVDQFFEAHNLPIPEVVHHLSKQDDVLTMVVFQDADVNLLRRDFPELVFSQSNRFGFDVNLHGGLKANGIRFLLSYLSEPENEVYAFGDGYNDIDMIAFATHGVAMGNAFDEVKAVAELVTGHVLERGVEHALIHYGLIKEKASDSDV